LTVFCAILTALLFGANAFPAKRLTERGWNESSVAWMNFAAGIPILWFAGATFGQWVFRDGFWGAFVLGLAGNFLAFTLYYRAIRLTDISIVLPLVSLSPVFMLVTSRVILGESPSPAGFAGVLLVGIGVYVLGCARDRSYFAAPIHAILRDPGARLALLVSFLWSITSNLDKKCVLASDSYVYPACFATAGFFLYAPIVGFRTGFADLRKAPPAAWGWAIALGVSGAVMILAQMTAIASMPAPYVIAIKRSGLLVGVVIGILRGESGAGWRLGGASLTVAGVAAILLGG
jgi:drug/metabolite transporter (DMT)-like permease